MISGIGDVVGYPGWVDLHTGEKTLASDESVREGILRIWEILKRFKMSLFGGLCKCTVHFIDLVSHLRGLHGGSSKQQIFNLRFMNGELCMQCSWQFAAVRKNIYT